MHIRLIKVVATLATLIAIVSSVGTASAAINIANGAAIIGGSGDFNGGNPTPVPFNTGAQFRTSNSTNGANATPNNDSGTVYENNADGSYWLGPHTVTSGYFVLDLGAQYSIGEIELFNTRNGPYTDRGTGNFKIYASNSITNVGANGMNLVSPVEIVSGILTNQTYSGGFGNTSTTPLVSDLFTASSAGPFQYLRFDALTVGAANQFGFGRNGVGLNEIRVFEATAIPEPMALVVFSSVGGMVWLLRDPVRKALSNAR